MPTAQTVNYASTVLDLALNAIKQSSYGNFFKNYVYGNPEEEIGIDDCPLFIGIKETTHVEQGPTGMDFITYKLLFRLVINKSGYDGKFEEDDVATMRELEQMIEGVDPSTGLYDSTSIIGILRNNFTLGGYAVNQLIDVNYGKVINPVVAEITREAQIQMTVEMLQLTPGKQ